MKDPVSNIMIYKSRHGFTLTELMVVVAIISILAAVSYPSYRSSVLKSRRTDALALLTSLQLTQEKWRSNNTEYATFTELSGPEPLSPIASTEGYYEIKVTSSVGEDLSPTTCAISGNPSSTAYALKATATSKNGQDQDAGCATICMDQDGKIYPSNCIQR